MRWEIYRTNDIVAALYNNGRDVSATGYISNMFEVDSGEHIHLIYGLLFKELALTHKTL